jgi:ribonuclease BN (tRNA processing enzyme)
MFEVEFLGVGSAFTVPPKGVPLDTCDWQSNLLVHSENGRKLLLDCGSDIRFSLREAGYTYADIDALYISHAHADHVGGMEGLAFSTYFSPTPRRPALYLSSSIKKSLWDQSLRGGLESLEGRDADLTEFFDVRPMKKNGWFLWEGIRFELIQVVHIMADRVIKHSYGLMIYEENGTKVFWTSDTQFCPNQIMKFYEQAGVILHDCETAFRSGVHAYYDDLVTLPRNIRERMFLYHYQAGAPEKRNAQGDGFAGFVRKGNTLVVNSGGGFAMRDKHAGA